MVVSDAVTANAHHGLAAHEVVLLLQTDPHRGLTTEVADERLKEFGPNTLPAPRGAGLVRRVLRQFHHPLIYVLLVAGVVTATLSEYVDSVVIFAVVVVNAIVGFVQETKAETALQSLRSMVRTEAKVIRDGRERTIGSDQLVPGDLVLVEAGDKVPADVRLIRESELRVDESALTGESVPVDKTEVVLPEATPVADRCNMAYSGTLVTAGSGAGVVVATGSETEIGEIHRLVGSAEVLATPLTAKLAWFSKILTIGILALAAATFALGLVRRQDAVETFTAAVALAVGAIPEGLPAAVTITLAIGVARMAKRRAVIRRLPAVETLGGTTVICADKTGTLTENQMTVRKVWTPHHAVTATGSGYAPTGALVTGDGQPMSVDADESLRWTLVAGAVCNDAALSPDGQRWQIAGDPTEAAMLVVAAKAGLAIEDLRNDFPRVAAIPFSSERQYMATLHRSGRHRDVVLVKGSVERMLELCERQMDADGTLRRVDRPAVMAAADTLAAEGLRVLACGVAVPADPSHFTEAQISGSITFTGLQAMLDPPRDAAAPAVAACHSAGISVKMITGDHPGTASAIAESVGVLVPGAPGQRSVMTGAQLAALSADEFPDLVDEASVFARVSPEQKLRLVEALQAKGHVVAMTGDGVNDVPALEQADVGIAMGIRGTDVARSVADVVLTDDHFASIVRGIEEGRRQLDNIRKFVRYLLSSNVGEVLAIGLNLLIGGPLLLVPVQILWLNLVTDGATALALGMEPAEPDVMRRPPESTRASLLTGPAIGTLLLAGAYMAGASVIAFHLTLSSTGSVEMARTAAFTCLVVVEKANVLNYRGLRTPLGRLGWATNPWLLGAIAVTLLLQVAAVYAPPLQVLLHTAALRPQDLALIGALAVPLLVVPELIKTVQISGRGRRLRSST